MSFAALLGLLAVVAFAFTVEAALGFGATVVTVSLGALFLPIDQLLPAFVPLNMVLSTVILVRERHHVDRRLLFGRILPLMALGLPLGLYGFIHLDRTLSRRLLGASVAVLAVLQLYALWRRRPPSIPRRWPGNLALFLAGVVHGAFATGGPLVVYVLGQRLPKATFRATLSALWLCLNVVLLSGYALNGRLSVESARTSLLLVVGLILGLGLGERLFRRVPETQFRVAIYALLLSASLLMLGRG